MPTSRAFEKLVTDQRQPLFDDLPDIDEGDPNAALAARFESFATTVQNRIDSDGSGPLTLTGSLDAQVQRALSQALRRGNSAQPSPGMAGPARAPVTSGYP